jgi:micrococcal nuclease
MRFSAIRHMGLGIVLLIAACVGSSEHVTDAGEETTDNSLASAQPTSRQPQRESTGIDQTTINCPDCRLVEVLGIVDGDTIDTSIGRVRFFGIDTPERGERCFAEATETTRSLVGNRIRLQDGPRQVDNFGRHLAYVFDPSGSSIDARLVAGGFASAWTRDGQHRTILSDLEQIAKNEQKGCLWEFAQ